MNLSNFIGGLSILSEYYDDQECYPLGAEHDIVYLAETDRPLNEKDVSYLRELGWFQEGHAEAEDAGGTAVYDPAAGWAAFT